MNEYLFEPFLTQYFLLEAICESFLSEAGRKEMYYKLAEIFCIKDTKELRNYYNDSKLEHFSEIKDSAAYERLCRTIEFAQKSGQDVELTDRDKMILAQKREAMVIKTELFRQVKNLSKETVSSALLTMAMNGNIDAMAALAYLEYNGLCVCKDTCSAIRRIRLCAKWNNLFGNLLGIAYDSENRQKYFDILYTVFRNASQKQVFSQICNAKEFEGNCSKDSVARIIEKAFGLGIIKRNNYDQVFAKVAFSQIVSAEYKEKLLLNKQKDAIVSLSNIPFDTEFEGELCFDQSCMENITLKRDNEIRKILLNIAVAKNCPDEAYSPLFIMSADEYVTEMYSETLKQGFSGASVVEIDASAFCRQDFLGGGENIFIRGLCETKSANTVFFIKNCEELDEHCLEELLKVLDYDYRKKFKLFNPTVSLDLSGLKFCLFATGRNSVTAELAECCDTVCAERINQSEKGLVVESVFKTRAQSFGCVNTVLEKDGKEYLSNYDAKQIQQIIDSTLRIAVFENKDTISLDTVKSVCEEQNIAAPRRGFGYMGGNANA